MTAPQAIWLFGFVAAGVAAFAAIALLHARAHPRVRLLSWLLTTLVAAIGIGWLAAISGASFAVGMAAVLVLAPLAYPALVAWAALEARPWRFARALEDQRQARRAILRAAPEAAPTTTPRAPAPPPAPVATAPGDLPPLPPLPPLPDSVVARLTADPTSRRSRIFGVVVVSVIGLAFAGMTLAEPIRRMTTAPQRVAAHREMVVAQLGIMGLQNVRLSRDQVQLYCTGGDGEAYHWTAEAADGRACVRDGEVQIKVERSRLTRDPFAR